jgi:hypothetical protein
MSLSFNDSSTEMGLCQETDRICHTNSTTYPLKDKARRANIGLNKFVTIAMESDTRWQFDDTNYTDKPIATTNLVASQSDYTMGLDMLKVLKIQVKDTNGNFVELDPIDINDSDEPLETRFATAGQPQYYDKVGNSIILYPAPSANSTGGLKVFFQRDASPFASTDTTKTPGIPSIFHPLIALYMAEPYLLEKGMKAYNGILNKITILEEQVREFYSKRNKDERPQITARIVDCR